MDQYPNLFVEQISQFLEKFSAEIDNKDQYIIGNQIPILRYMYNKVQEQKGFLRLFSQVNIEDFFPQERLVDIYWKYFLTFEYFTHNKDSVSKLLDSNLLQKTNRYLAEEFFNSQNPDWNKHQVSLMSLPQEVMEELNKDKFTFEAIKKNHGTQQIDVRIQNTSTDSFQNDLQNNRKLSLTINQYMKYKADPAKFIDKLNSDESNSYIQPGSILFAVNVDMDTWSVESAALKTFFQNAGFGTELDGLSWTRQYVQGVTIPQIYLKVEGVFTGGHQENLSVNSININHGPMESLWISVDLDHVETLRQIVLQEEGVDILLNQGLWWKEPLYFLQRGIPIKYTVQKAGDVIFIGPGCLHQVKSLGETVQSAWNYMSLSLEMLQAMTARYFINKQINYPTVIPIKILFLDLLHHKKNDLQQEMLEYLQKQTIRFNNEEESKIDRLVAQIKDRLGQIVVEKTEDAHEILLCSECSHEIFNYFFMCESKWRGYDRDFFCIDCILSEKCETFNETQRSVVYHKYNHIQLNNLINLRLDHQETLCGNYIGKTSCTKQWSFKIQKKRGGRRGRPQKIDREEIEDMINIDDIMGEEIPEVNLPILKSTAIEIESEKSKSKSKSIQKAKKQTKGRVDVRSRGRPRGSKKNALNFNLNLNVDRIRPYSDIK